MPKLVIPKPQPTATEKAKASLKASMAFHDKPKRQPKPIMVVLGNKRGFASWTAQNPAAAHTFGIMLRRWLSSNATVRGVPGYWAAWTYPQWSKWAGVSVATFKRHLDRVEEAGLLERQLHRHGGTKVLAYIRPTPLALTVAGVHPADWPHLGLPGPVTAELIKPMEALEASYRAAYLSYKSTPIVVISKEERAAMRAIIKAVPNAAQIVDITVTHWLDFMFHVAKATGFPNTPDQPSMAFIRKHLQSAADFSAKHQPPPKSSEPNIKPSPPVQAIANSPEPDEAKPTLADILAPVDPDDLPMTEEALMADLAEGK